MNPFVDSIKQVENWLSSNKFVRIVGKKRSWRFSITEGYFKGESITLFLPETFPASPAAIYIDPKYFLVLPHVESDGRICLNVPPVPEDYEKPIESVIRALCAFEKSWFKTTTGSVSHEFHRERLSYWSQYQETERNKLLRWRLPADTFVELSPFKGWMHGQAVCHIQKGHRERQISCQVATAKPNGDARALARRHGFDKGSLYIGKALFIQLPANMHWVPKTWPRKFDALSELVKECTDNQVNLHNWIFDDGYGSQKVKKKKQGKRLRHDLSQLRERPLLIFFVQEHALFGYQILPIRHGPSKQIQIAPLRPERIDASWALTRDHQVQALEQKQEKRVLVIGCGSLGSPIIELLARSGVGHLDILDEERFEIPNISRHILGIRAVNTYKAKALANRLFQEIPGVRIGSVSADLASWFSTLKNAEKYDLIIECTGESSVRTLISRWRDQMFVNTPLIHTWLEPFCSAAHIVLSQVSDPWPWEDPADDKVNIASFDGTNHKVMLPACNSGFHPYGPTDVWGAASFVAERSLAVLEAPSTPSSIWSWVRTKAFYNSLPVFPVIYDESVLATGGILDKKTIERDYADILGTRRSAHAQLVAV